MKKLIISLAATLALSSCGIYSKYKPATEVPDGLYGQEGANPSDSASNLGSLPWQEVFTDPCLRTLIDTALVRNTDLRTAHLRVKEAEATLLSARLSYLPAFSLSPQGTASSFDGRKASQTYSLPASASWEIDIFVRLTNAKRRAQAVVAQSRDYEQAVQTQLIAAVANNYYTLLMLDAQIEISTATEAAWKESVATTRAMKAAGMVTEAETSIQSPPPAVRRSSCVSGPSRPSTISLSSVFTYMLILRDAPRKLLSSFFTVASFSLRCTRSAKPMTASAV